MTDVDPTPAPEADSAARRVGRELRRLRTTRRWSLSDVEAHSGGEFKASVMGAYERGEREMGLDRLFGLARLYEIPASALVTLGEEPMVAVVSVQVSGTPEHVARLASTLAALSGSGVQLDTIYVTEEMYLDGGLAEDLAEADEALAAGCTVSLGSVLADLGEGAHAE